MLWHWGSTCTYCCVCSDARDLGKVHIILYLLLILLEQQTYNASISSVGLPVKFYVAHDVSLHVKQQW